MTDELTISITCPKPYQVIQRQGFDPKNMHFNCIGGPRAGSAAVKISGCVNCTGNFKYEARTVLLSEAFGNPVEWTVLETDTSNGRFHTELDVPAGGWYRLELRVTEVDGNCKIIFVEPFGVGELFIIAGQSYAENCNDALMRVNDSQGRITACDLGKEEWRVADDPQPIVAQRKEKWGSIWPAAMNLLLSLLRVPIGMINVAVGGTSSRQWMPGGELFSNLVKAGKEAGDFRYVLWQQGESDVIDATSIEVYKERIIYIKSEFEKRLNKPTQWLLAKSTYHPVVYNEPEREAWIRQAIDDLWNIPGFLRGPDTDILGGIGIYRAKWDEHNSGHFTELGQQMAGLMWFSAIWNNINGGL